MASSQGMMLLNENTGNSFASWFSLKYLEWAGYLHFRSSIHSTQLTPLTVQLLDRLTFSNGESWARARGHRLTLPGPK